MSLPLDALVLALGVLPATAYAAQGTLDTILTVLLAATLLLLPRQWWLELMKNLKDEQRAFASRYGYKLQIALALIIVAMSVEFILPLLKLGLHAILVAVIALLAYVPALRKQLRFFGGKGAVKNYSSGSTTDLLTVLFLAPLITARAVSVIGVIKCLGSATPLLSYLPYGFASIVLLMSLAPEITLFYATCRRCACDVSTLSTRAGCCSSCRERGRY